MNNMFGLEMDQLAKIKVIGVGGDDYRLESVRSINWMFMGLYEWTITPQTNGTTSVASFIISEYGFVHFYVNYYSLQVDVAHFAIRPCFYLNQDVTYVSGNGTKNSPYIIK